MMDNRHSTIYISLSDSDVKNLKGSNVKRKIRKNSPSVSPNKRNHNLKKEKSFRKKKSCIDENNFSDKENKDNIELLDKLHNNLNNIEKKFIKLKKKKKNGGDKKKFKLIKLILKVLAFILVIVCLYFIITKNSNILSYLNVENNINSGGNVNCGGSVTVNKDMSAGGSVTVNKDISAGGSVTVNKDISAGGSVTVNKDIASGGSVTVNKDIASGGSATVTKDITCGGDITSSGTVTATTVVQKSDGRLKKNFNNLQDTYSKILNLSPLSYNIKDDESERLKYGFIAQEVEKIFPELIHYSENKEFKDQLNIDYISIIPLIIDALKIQNEMIKELLIKAE